MDRSSASGSLPAAGVTASDGVRSMISSRRARCMPASAASASTSAATPRPMPPDATAERKLVKASLRALRR